MTNKTIKFLVSEVDNGKRLDVFLTKNIDNFSRSFIKKLIQNNSVNINNNLIKSSAAKVRYKDEIEVNFLVNNISKIKSKKMKLNIIYEDNDIAIINKPKGMIVHPGAGNINDTLANGLAYRYKKKLSDINGSLRPGIVHRIDKDTSGLLVIAKNNLSHAHLGNQFSNHTIKRQYQCLIWGVIRPLQGRIETLISRNERNRQLMTVSTVKGKKSITNYKTLKIFDIKDIPKISLLECNLETGRTHQIRVHLKYKNTSILGDYQYGKKKLNFKKINKLFLQKIKKIKGQTLHAKTLEFIHPTKNKSVSFDSELPTEFKKMIEFLNNLNG